MNKKGQSAMIIAHTSQPFYFPISLTLTLDAREGGSPVHVFDLEVDAHSGYKGLGECVVAVAHQESRLPHARVAHYENLVHVVETRVGRRIVAVHLVHGEYYTAPLNGLTSSLGCRRERRDRRETVRGMRDEFQNGCTLYGTSAFRGNQATRMRSVTTPRSGPHSIEVLRLAMALSGLLFPILGFFFIVLWTFLALLKVAWIILTSPFTALKKTTRESEGSFFVRYVFTLFLFYSPPGVSVGPGSGFPRVRDSQWTQVPLCLWRRHVQTSHVAASWLPRGHLSHPSQSSHTSHASYTSQVIVFSL